MSNREKLINWGVGLLFAVVAGLLARYGIKVDPPPVIVLPSEPVPPVQPPPDKPPSEPTPDALAAIVRISSGNVGCSATVIGPRRPDGRYWVLTAAHCVSGTGQRWTMKFRDGRTSGMQVVNFNRTSDFAWCVTDGNNLTLPHALLAESTPAVGTRLWHAGYGVDVPANREDGELLAHANAEGQIRFRMSVSSGDSGGGVVIDSGGKIVSTVCCTTRKGAVADVWGASPEVIKIGQRDTVDLDDWKPIDIPTRDLVVPNVMPAKKP